MIRVDSTVLRPSGQFSTDTAVFTQAPWVIAVIVVAIVLALIAIVAVIVVSVCM